MKNLYNIIDMKKSIILIILLFIFISNFSFSQIKITNAYKISISGNIKSTVIDSFGNFYHTGIFLDTLHSNNSSFISNGSQDILIAKSDTSGNLLWLKTIGGTGLDIASSINIDNQENIYICGIFRDTVNFDPGLTNYTLNTDTSEANGFILKLDSNGNFLWAYKTNAYCQSLKINNDNDIFITGSFEDSVDFDFSSNDFFLVSDTLNSDAFLLKLNSLGQFVWATHLSNTFTGLDIFIDNNDNIFITGGGFPSSSFIAKIDPFGNINWFKESGGTNSRNIVTSLNGSIFISGDFGNTQDFDPGPNDFIINNNNNEHNPFIYKLDSNGNFIWAKAFQGGRGFNIDISVDNNDQVYLVGNFVDTMDFISGSSESHIIIGGHDAFLAKLDEMGNLKWSTSIGHRNQIEGLTTILKGLDNKFYCIGAFRGNSNFLDFNIYPPDTIGLFIFSFEENNIIGKVIHDYNSNCIGDGIDFAFPNKRILINPGSIVTESNNSGFWSIPNLLPGAYTATVETLNSNWLPTCPITQSFNVVHSDSFIQGPNFGFVSAFPCPSPDVSIVMPRVRRGFSNQLIYVTACNNFTATGILDSAYTIVEIHPQISVQNASIPYTLLGNNNHRFELGDIYPGQCINFTITATVTTQAVANQTLCLSAELFPQADCVFDSIPTPYDESPSGSVTPCTLPWDRSSLRVEGECIGDSVRFVIYNTGSFGGGDMDCFAPVRVYVDGQWVMLDSIRIVGGDSVVFMFAGTGGTIRLEADQHPLHPGNSHPNANVENCGNGTWTPGIINTMPQNDADPVIDIYCGQVTAPYDPNDKTGFPLGVGTNHNIRQNQQIEYLIRFQNIGTDTAFNIVIQDTLSTDLNIFTVQSEVASHPYEFRMYGPRIMEWTFRNIMLPDSNVNEAASHGFVKFTVQQNPNLPFGTVIENNAAIYFDFEAPVITNTYFHTISDFSIQVSTEKLEGPLTEATVSVIPNPFKESAIVKVEGIENSENLELEIFSLSGQRIQYLSNSQNGQFELSRRDMIQGIYFFSIRQNGKVVARGKMVVE